MLNRDAISVVLVATSLFTAVPLQAADSSSSVAEVALVSDCEQGEARDKSVPSALPSFLVPIFANLIGDVAAAGLNTIGNAIDEASSEKAFGAEGSANFEFYRARANVPNMLVPAFKIGASCLSLTVRAPRKKPDEIMSPFIIADEPERPVSLVVNTKIHTLRDGFYLEPVYVYYPYPLPGAPKRKALPAELHVSFATPGSINNGNSVENVFALFRIPLPPIRPGERWAASELNLRSNIMPFRPETGAPAALKERFLGRALVTSTGQALHASEVELAHTLGMRLKDHRFIACVSVPCPTWVSGLQRNSRLDFAALISTTLGPKSKMNDDQRKAIASAVESRETAVLAFDKAVSRFERATGMPIEEFGLHKYSSYNEPLFSVETYSLPAVGSTSVKARFVLIRDANKFGQAIAKALKKQSEPLGTAISKAISKEDDPAWTQGQTDYAVAVLDVEHKQNALDRAKTADEPDPEVIEKAEADLLTAKATANIHAAAVEKPIPYPEIGSI